ncbi:MAG: hypothetical protein NTU44_02975 [Bacteroidetes bacterium]|nr:hypothetical protein [Bacteroidota bacterium]
MSCFCQDGGAKFGIRFSGFVRTDLLYDTRENVNLREGHFLLYPENRLKDQNGKDINAVSNFNLLSINSRLKGVITGPDAWGAKTTGLIEGEFFGVSDADINGFRLRHAYVKLKWPKTELMAGQYWHPMFIAESYPLTASFNTGAPFQPFNRSPQVRLSHQFGKVTLMAAAVGERDFSSMGPNPADPSKSINSSLYIRNSGMPEWQFLFQYRPDSTGNHLLGFGFGTKSIHPELSTIGTNKTAYQSNEKLVSLSAHVFAKIVLNPVTVRLQAVYCQNATALTMLGGYAVKEVTDTTTGNRTFTPITTISFWGDFQTMLRRWNLGLFAGYSGNLGAQDEVYKGIFYSRGKDIGYLYRIAPRVMVTSGKLDLIFEVEYTVAAYGIPDSKGVVMNTTEVANIRPLVVISYNF